MKRQLMIVCVGLAIAGGVTTASATTVTYTYTGTVAGGTDIEGIFGPAYTDLTGDSFTAVETFDLSKQAYQITDGSTYQEVYGGPGNGGPPGFASATLTINSGSLSIVGDAAFTDNTQGQNNVTQVYDPVAFRYLDFDVLSPLTPASVSTSYSVKSPGAGSGGDLGGSYDVFSFNVTGLTVSASVSEVPLPASAPLFGAALFGLGAVGFGIRRKKTTAQA